MLRTIFIFFVLLIASFMGLLRSFQSGSFLRFIDQHPNQRYVPPVVYMVGQFHLLFQDLPEAATYFWRVSEQYKDSAYADDAYFYYLQTLDDLGSRPRRDMAEVYVTYLERFPKGKNAKIVQHRIDTYRTGA